MHISSLSPRFDTCKSPQAAHLHIDFICVFVFFNIALHRVRRVGQSPQKVWAHMQLAHRKKGMFDEAVQTRANCIIQRV